jgi:uncharacterized membrane protein YccC
MAKPSRAVLFAAVFLALVALAGVAFRVAFVSLLIALVATAAAGGMAWWVWRKRRSLSGPAETRRLDRPDDRRP